MNKRIKKIVRISVVAVLLFVAIVIGSVVYLYQSADMLTPQMASASTDQVLRDANLSRYKNNYLRQSESGLWELKVEGNGFERGEAIGKLSPELLYYQEKVFVDQIKEMIPSESYLKFLRYFIAIFNRNLGKNVPEEYRDEIYGVSLGCTHEYDFIGTPYERQLNYHSAHDLGHAMQDYMLVGCSSFAAWGENSADSSLIIGRNFDFYVGDKFAQNKQVSFVHPDKGYKFAAVGWPGMIGVLSGMNETGLTVTINAAKSSMPTSSATPISILTREILQYASTIDEAYTIAQQRKTFVSESILIGSAKDGRAAIIEKSPEKTALFTGTTSGKLPENATSTAGTISGKSQGEQPVFPAEQRPTEKSGTKQDDIQLIICTNHFQSEAFSKDPRNLENIATSDSPYRYERLQELLQENKPIDYLKAASILRNWKGKKGANLGLANEMAINQFICHHSVVFQPEKLLMWVSTSPWQCGKYVAYDLRKVFNDSVDFRHEIYTPSLTIPEDPFLQEEEYTHLLNFKQLTPEIRKATSRKEPIIQPTLDLYKSYNPSFYYTYEVLGDYYAAIGKPEEAAAQWKEALKRPIPKQQERERIEKKLKIKN